MKRTLRSPTSWPIAARADAIGGRRDGAGAEVRRRHARRAAGPAAHRAVESGADRLEVRLRAASRARPGLAGFHVPARDAPAAMRRSCRRGIEGAPRRAGRAGSRGARTRWAPRLDALRRSPAPVGGPTAARRARAAMPRHRMAALHDSCPGATGRQRAPPRPSARCRCSAGLRRGRNEDRRAPVRRRLPGLGGDRVRVRRRKASCSATCAPPDDPAS